jgi:hypothetical protein
MDLGDEPWYLSQDMNKSYTKRVRGWLTKLHTQVHILTNHTYSNQLRTYIGSNIIEYDSLADFFFTFANKKN